jgi:quinohemoprotein ethanol dehydrogenase
MLLGTRLFGVKSWSHGVTFTNVGDIPHRTTELKQAKWDRGVAEKGQSKAITFSEPGNYHFICTPHTWMQGQIIVE